MPISVCVKPIPSGERRTVEGVERRAAIETLASAGCVSPDAEADALFAAAAERGRPVAELVADRAGGRPLAWVTGSVVFCDEVVRVDRGVFVPRPHTEPLARRAAALLPDDGVAVDLCTGSGVVAVVLSAARPGATVLATDVDPAAVACARSNGVAALEGDLDEPLPTSIRGRIDVMTAVVPYVPSEELHLLPRDVRANEPRVALDGGPGGTVFLARAAAAAERLLAPGGTVLLELGGDQADAVAAALSAAGCGDVRVLRDDDGRDRAVEARRLSGRTIGTSVTVGPSVP